MTHSDFDAPDLPKTDFFLQTLVEAVNESGLEVGLTLTVKGAVISGITVSMKRFFEENAAMIRSAGKGTLSEESSESLAQGFESLLELVAERDANEPNFKAPPAFVHLRDACYLLDPHTLSSPAVWWRGRLSEVDGFSIGILTQHT
jgi:hypothetical protein